MRFVSLDVTDADSVSAAATRLGDETGPLDVLVNNAGVAPGDGEGLPSVVRVEAIQRTLDVNFYGTLRVTQAFLPLVRQARAGRIVNVSSTTGSIGTLVAPDTPLARFPAFAYPVSKTVLNALTGWLSLELADTPIKVNSVCPGYVNTELNGNLGTRQPADSAADIVRAATLPADGPSGSFFDASGPVSW